MKNITIQVALKKSALEKYDFCKSELKVIKILQESFFSVFYSAKCCFCLANSILYFSHENKTNRLSKQIIRANPPSCGLANIAERERLYTILCGTLIKFCQVVFKLQNYVYVHPHSCVYYPVGGECYFS